MQWYYTCIEKNMQEAIPTNMLWIGIYSCTIRYFRENLQDSWNCNNRKTILKHGHGRLSKTAEITDWNYNGVSQVTGTSNTFVGTSFVELLTLPVSHSSTETVRFESKLYEREPIFPMAYHWDYTRSHYSGWYFSTSSGKNTWQSAAERGGSFRNST